MPIVAQELLQTSVDHTVHSPDLASSNYQLFQKLKSHLAQRLLMTLTRFKACNDVVKKAGQKHLLLWNHDVTVQNCRLERISQFSFNLKAVRIHL